jgi:hypothetical protein
MGIRGGERAGAGTTRAEILPAGLRMFVSE